MSLYNQLHGVNPLSGHLLEWLDIDQKELGQDFPEELAAYYENEETGKTERYLDWSPCDEPKVGWDAYNKAREDYIKVLQAQHHYESGRFRDIHLNKDGTRIILYTRNGGGNREAYQYVFDLLRKNPNYVRDWDDDFDCTYAYIEFTVPKEFEKLAKALANGEDPKTIHEKFEETMKEMEGMTPEQMKTDPRFAPTVKMLEDIAGHMGAES